MGDQATEAVGPHGAVRTSDSHVVDKNEVVLISKQIRKTNVDAVRRLEDIVLYKLFWAPLPGFEKPLLGGFDLVLEL